MSDSGWGLRPTNRREAMAEQALAEKTINVLGDGWQEARVVLARLASAGLAIEDEIRRVQPRLHPFDEAVIEVREYVGVGGPDADVRQPGVLLKEPQGFLSLGTLEDMQMPWTRDLLVEWDRLHRKALADRAAAAAPERPAKAFPAQALAVQAEHLGWPQDHRNGRLRDPIHPWPHDTSRAKE